MACRPAMGESPLFGPWQVAHCASSACFACVVSSQFLVVVLHVAMTLRVLQLASLVQPVLEGGKPSTLGGAKTADVALASTPPSGSRAPEKKRLSWQVPHAAREGLVIHASFTWQVVQLFSIATDAGRATPGVPPVGMIGKPTFRKAVSEESAPKP